VVLVDGRPVGASNSLPQPDYEIRRIEVK